jgi:hypothetical protein
MKIAGLRVPLAMFSVLVATSAWAEQIELAKLQCVPLPPTESAAVTPTCGPEENDLVVVEGCSCPGDFQLVRLTAPASILVLEATPLSQ